MQRSLIIGTVDGHQWNVYSPRRLDPSSTKDRRVLDYHARLGFASLEEVGVVSYLQWTFLRFREEGPFVVLQPISISCK